MADPKTSVSDYQRGKADAYADVIRQGKAVHADERNAASDRHAVLAFVDRFTRLIGHAELIGPFTE